MRFTSSDLDSPPESGIEMASWSRTGAEQYMDTSNEISLTDLGDFRYVEGMSAASADKIKAAGIESEFVLFILAAGLYDQPAGLALILKVIGIKYPVHLAGLIYSKLARLWYIPYEAERLDTTTEYPVPNIKRPFELNKPSKERILEFVFQNPNLMLLKKLQLLEITPHDLIKYVTDFHGENAFETNFLSYMAEDNAIEVIKFIKEIHDGEEWVDDFLKRLTAKNTKLSRYVRRNLAWRRRRHMVPGFVESHYLPYEPAAGTAAAAGAAGAATGTPRRRHRTRRNVKRRRNTRRNEQK